MGENLALQRNSVTVRVPATTANMGPGFDCIGMALDIWNELTVEKADAQIVDVIGEGASFLPTDDSNLVIVGMKAAFKIGQRMAAMSRGCDASLIHEACRILYAKEYDDVKLPHFRYTCINRIPFARGLGSSSAAVVSGLVAGLVLTGVELPVANEEALLNFACAIEGHPDNVAPAIYGGLQIGVKFTSGMGCVDDAEIPKWITSQVAIPNGLQCVLFLPNATTETVAARALLPTTVSRDDAIFNNSRSALLINALSTGAFHNLKIAMDDKLHQPYRGASEQGSHIYALISAAIRAGAHSACLSGAGPAILALTSGAKGMY